MASVADPARGSVRLMTPGYGRTMTTLIGRRGVGGFYAFHHHPWLVVVLLAVVVALIVWQQRKG